MTTLPKTYALAAARKAVGPVERLGCSYVVRGPLHNDDIYGPRMELQTVTFAKGREVRAAWIAMLALQLMRAPYEYDDLVVSSGNAATRVAQVLHMIECRAA
jgi:hypothetical protein